MKKRLYYAIAIFFVALFLVMAGAYWYLDNFSKQKIHLNEPKQLITLVHGTSVPKMIKQIEQIGLIERADLIPYLLKVRPDLSLIKAGTYELAQNMTVEDFLSLLVSGKEAQFGIKFIEGHTVKEWLKELKTAPYLAQTLEQMTSDEVAKKLGIKGSIEGWLYPDTYYYTSHTNDLAILKRAHQKMVTTLEAIWQNRSQNLPYQSPYEMLIMASLIEKETSIDAERAKVASVFINRINRKMKLQTDPTIIYGLGDRYQGRIFRRDLEDTKNPYNTYVISGLPPTPIAMPSLASLEAAAHPEKTTYLYFVADGRGGHTFSTNYFEHQVAVKKYWQLMKEQRK